MKKEYYQIVTDEKALLDFINWLPDLTVNEKFYYCLFARKKYSSQLIKSNDRTQLKRGLATKENLFNKIKQLELPLGTWELKGIPAPQESLVVYINPNPRDVIKGAWKTVNKLCKILENHSNGHNPVAECLSAIQQSKSRNFVVDFDIDTDDKVMTYEIISRNIIDILPEKYYKILETRGGYHLLVTPPPKSDKITHISPERRLFPKCHNMVKGEVYYIHQECKLVYPENWYKAIQEAFRDNLDQSGDNLMPIPGCVQGGFTPKFIEI